MSLEIIGSFDRNKLYCVASFTKFLTTFVCLSLLAENYELNDILDNPDFLDTICTNTKSRDFLKLFQKTIGSKFTIRDLCTYYAGLPYTFDLSEEELESVDSGMRFKHHCITDEETFLTACRTQITPVYPVGCKFHYSELSIIFLGYLIEKIYNTEMEVLYKTYLINRFNLQDSIFSRTLINEAFIHDFSDKYDYPSIAITSHGYFCYSNGFYTTLNDQKILLEGVVEDRIFAYMTDIKHARAASNRLLNGLTVEIRLKDDDVIYGYEGLSFSGCTIWAYSNKHKKGYLTFTDSEEDAYPIIYDKFGYYEFDKVPEYTQVLYRTFLEQYPIEYQAKNFPIAFQGTYLRVLINEKMLDSTFSIGTDFIVIRNPGEIKYNAIYINDRYRIKNKDNLHGSKIGLYTAKSGNKYMLFDGNLYKHRD